MLSVPKAKTCLAVIAALLVAGCNSNRPASVTCNGLEPAMAFQTEPSESAMVQADAMIEQSATQTIRALERTTPRGPVELNVLVLSAGGQYGSFGAGFLTGWSGNGRPDFDLVTGVSAGAMLAPAAFAGSDFDGLLRRYDGISEDQVLRRNYLGVLTGLSATTPEPLADYLDASLNTALLTRIAERQKIEGAELFISAASLDTTASRVFRLSDIAAADAPEAQKRDCMREAMLASAAIPVIFPPRHIDGEFYADGGLREHVFLRGIEEARANVAAQEGRDIQVNAFIIVNGELAVPQLRPDGSPAEPVDNNVLSIAQRSAAILGDEVLRNSIAETVSFALDQNERGRRQTWTVRGIIAPRDATAGCPEADLTFDPCITSALFAAGQQKGRAAPISWMTGEELLQIANEL